MSDGTGDPGRDASVAGERRPGQDELPGPGGGAGRALEVALRAGVGVSFARILPRASAALELSLVLGGPRWQAEVGGLFAPPVAGGDARIGGVFLAGAGVLRGCPVMRRGPFAAPLCLGVLLGALEGSGRGTDLVTKRTERALWLAATAGAGLTWRGRGRVGLWLHADAIVGLVRPRFVTTAGTEVHHAARWGGQVLAGLRVRLR